MSFAGIEGKKAKKSLAAVSFIRPVGPLIRWVIEARSSVRAQGGYAIGFIVSAFGSAVI
jgi:hypothetical protein